MTLSAAARERRAAAQRQRDQWLPLDPDQRSAEIKDSIHEYAEVFIANEGQTTRLAPEDFEDFEVYNADRWQDLRRMSISDMLSANRRYYHTEIGLQLQCSSRYVFALKSSNSPTPSGLKDHFNMDNLFRVAKIIFADTNHQWDTPYETLVEYDQLMSSFNILDSKPWPRGFAVDHDEWQARLPRDLFAPEPKTTRGDRLPPRKRMQKIDTDISTDLIFEGGGLDVIPTLFPNTKANAKVIKKRMLGNMMSVIRNREPETAEAMISAMFQRALRSEAIARYLQPMRVLVCDELRRREAQQRPSEIVALVSGCRATEVAEVLLPYVDLVSATHLAETCKVVHDWCRAHGIAARLGITPSRSSDEELDAADIDTMEGRSRDPVTGALEVEKNKFFSVHPIVYYKRAFVNSDGVYESARVTAFPVANQKVVVGNGRSMDSSFSSCPWYDDAARTPLLPYGGNNMVEFGCSEGVIVRNIDTAGIRRCDLPPLKLKVLAAESKRWFDRKLRIRLQLHTMLQPSHTAPAGESMV